MATQPTSPSSALEQALINIIRILPLRRAAQVLDFARWLQTQPVPDKLLDEGITPIELELEEKSWEQVLSGQSRALPGNGAPGP
jgi:hypothetical protein